jgi:hypothetical protein
MGDCDHDFLPDHLRNGLIQRTASGHDLAGLNHFGQTVERPLGEVVVRRVFLADELGQVLVGGDVRTGVGETDGVAAVRGFSYPATRRTPGWLPGPNQVPAGVGGGRLISSVFCLSRSRKSLIGYSCCGTLAEPAGASCAGRKVVATRVEAQRSSVGHGPRS